MKTNNITRITFTVNHQGKIEVKKIESVNEKNENPAIKGITKTPARDVGHPSYPLNKIRFRIDPN